MLYCPKCQQTYEDGVQRFCTNDDTRLLPAASAGKSAGGVFSNVINRKSSEENDEFANAPRFSQMAFQPPPSKIFKSAPETETAPIEIPEFKDQPADVPELKSEAAPLDSKSEIKWFEEDLQLELEPLNSNAPHAPDSLLELRPEPDTATVLEDREEAQTESEMETDVEVESEAETEVESETTETEIAAETQTEATAEIGLDEIETATVLSPVNENELVAEQADLDDGQTDPVNETAVSWDNPQVLIGRTVKDRYRIVEQFGADENAIDYLAEDKINPEKWVVVRVLMDEETDDSLFGKIFAEERETLSRISHPSIIRVIDSGELAAGKPFVVTEYAKGESVQHRLDRKGKFDALRTARIIRQAAYALSEVHQSGILHRSLNSENLILTVNDFGAEQVKLINFGSSNVRLNEKNLLYKSPEQVEGKLANFASDEFSLAVVAYQMLTNLLPFNADRIGSLLKEQREGLIVKTVTVNDKLPSSVDEILSKALSFNPADRYPQARDFGDALFNAVTAEKSPAKSSEVEEVLEKHSEVEDLAVEESAVEDLAVEESSASISDPPVNGKAGRNMVLTANFRDALIAEQVIPTTAEKAKAAEKSSSEKSLPKATAQNSNRALFAVLGAAILVAAIAAVWLYLNNQPKEIKTAAPTPLPSVAPTANTAVNSTVLTVNSSSPNTTADIESFPPPRTVAQPPNTEYFQNSKDNLSAEAAKHFLGFSLYYPQSWNLKEAKNNFLDVSKTDENNLPVEQLLVSYYDSLGTFKSDRELFPKLLEKSNADLKKALGDYQIISQGETAIQSNRWQAFEVKFESAGTMPNGEKITLWGRRLWIPAQMMGTKNGYVITMLATSLSPDVKSVEDVGVKGELSNILETFEPSR